MFNIEYIRIEERRLLLDPTHYIIINEIVDKASKYRRENGRDKIELSDRKIIEEVLKQQLFELKKKFSNVKFQYPFDDFTNKVTLELYFNSDHTKHGGIRAFVFNFKIKDFIEILFHVDLEEWKNPYSIKEFIIELRKSTSEDENFRGLYCQVSDFQVFLGFGFVIELSNLDITFKSELDSIMFSLKKHVHDILKKLLDPS